MRVQLVAVLFLTMLAYSNAQFFESMLESIPKIKDKSFPNLKNMMGKSGPATVAGDRISVKMVPLGQVICASVLPGMPAPAMCATATTEAVTTTTASTPAAAALGAPAPPPPAAAPAPAPGAPAPPPPAAAPGAPAPPPPAAAPAAAAPPATP